MKKRTKTVWIALSVALIAAALVTGVTFAALCTRDDARSASPAARSPPALAPRRGKPGKPRRGGANGARKCGEGRVFGGFASPCAA